ncbi:MAG: hypothetical protein D6E12_17085, partial [Desulfovibrio sp.]
APLTHILRYAFNPNLPTYLAYPNSVRLGGWSDPASARAALDGIWNQLPGVEEPIVFRGVEFEESAPGEAVGAYYRYNMDRLLVLYTYQGMDILISVSKQQGESSVGKKGIPVGESREWLFFYSGLTGSMSGAANLVDTYVYQACSINVFIEPEPGRPLSRMCLFKWIQAGGGLFTDMVGSDDIRSGFAPYAMGFKQVLESQLLPPPEDIALNMAKVQGFTTEELRERMRPLANRMESEAVDHPLLSRSEFMELLENAEYMNILGKEEMQSELFKEYMRQFMR